MVLVLFLLSEIALAMPAIAPIPIHFSTAWSVCLSSVTFMASTIKMHGAKWEILEPTAETEI